jgi:ribosome-binding protein aMBF1 (putative translation factor)
MEEKKIVDRLISTGPQSAAERERLREIREQVEQEFPPSSSSRLKPAIEGVGAQIRAARESRGMSWYAVAEKANLPDASIVRDLECGREVTFSTIEAVAAALGLKIELVKQAH